jgi:hypothetical protein
MTPGAWLGEAYRSASTAQRRWIWALAGLCGAYLPFTIDRVGVTRTESGRWLSLPWAAGIFAVAFVAALAIVTSKERPEPAAPSRSLWRSTLKYAAPPFAVFCVYLLVYFPAMMNADSYDQWHQIIGYRFDAFFPIAHTLVYWLPTLVWRSPAAPILVQMVLLALAFGFSMAAVERCGAPRWLLWACTVLFALHPVNGFFSVTFLKDVLFSAAILWLTVVVFVVIRSGGGALTSRTTLVHLVLALSFVALLRPNGPVPAFGTAVLLWAVFRREWRRLLVVSGAFLAIYLGTNVGLAKATHLSYVNSGFYSASPFIFDIGAVLHSDLVPDPRAKPAKPKYKHRRPVETRIVNRNGKVRPDEWATLTQFENVHEWGRLYRPDLIPYWHTKRDEWELLDRPEKKAELVRVWWAFARRYPGIILQHKIAAASVGWKLAGDDFSVQMETYEPEESRLKQPVPSFSPSLRTAADELLRIIQKKASVRWFVTFPAIYTYACLFLLGAFAIRRTSWLALLIGAPLVLNWVATMAFCMAQNTRYFYASYLVLPFFAVLSWTAKVTVAAPQIQEPAPTPEPAPAPEVPDGSSAASV